MHRGFTLIELMICVAIIGILACAAVPLYHGYVNEASATEARTNLADIASKEEAYFSSWGAYVGVESDQFPQSAGSDYSRSVQSMAANDNWTRIGYPYHSDDNGGLFAGPVYFKYMVDVNDNASGYKACAHRFIGQNQQVLSISSTNRRAFSETSGSDCTAPAAVANVQEDEEEGGEEPANPPVDP